MDDPFQIEIPDITTEDFFWTAHPDDGLPDNLGQYKLSLVGWLWDLANTGQLTPVWMYTNGTVYLTTEAVDEILNLSAAISLQAQGERDIG